MLKDKIFRYLAGFISIYHILLGLAGIFGSRDFIEPIISRVYGVTPVFDAQFLYLAKFISAYFIVFGLMMGFVALNPRRYAQLAWVAIALFAIRITQRLVFFGLLKDAFHITFAQNLQILIPITLLLIGLIVFHPGSNTDQK